MKNTFNRFTQVNSDLMAGVQSLLASAGSEACYALCLLKIAEAKIGKPVPVVSCLMHGIDSGFIQYNYKDPNDKNNFFVSNPDKFVTAITGRQCTVRREGPSYIPDRGEFIVDRWERKTTSGTIAHFRLPDWDSLFYSRTVQEGEKVSTRVIKFID